MVKKKDATIKTFFESLLRRMYSAERDILDQLDKMIEATSSSQLKQSFEQHKKETLVQTDRLEKSFEILGLDLKQTNVGEAEGLLEKGKEIVKSLATMTFSSKSKAIQGIIEEGKEVFEAFADTPLHDLALTTGVQAIEISEIAAYSVLCLLAKKCNYPEVLQLLEKSLDEERAAYNKLGEIADKEIRTTETN